MQPSKETLAIRNEQSRVFHTQSNKQLLQASLSVLQDMGYTLKESSTEYGVLTAVKEASAISKKQVAGALALTLLTGVDTPFDKTQVITATVVVMENDGSDQAIARTTFQRIITRTDNTQYFEVVSDQNTYQDFYEKLDKALFLEINSV